MKALLAAITRSINGDSKTRKNYTIVGTFFFFFHIVLTFVLGIIVDHFFSLAPLFNFPLNLFVSLPFTLIGLIFVVWSIIRFLKVKGTPIPFNPPPKLVIQGPYAYTRNPMLSGWFFLFLGIGLVLNSFATTLIFVPLWILSHIYELKTVEEPELQNRFGISYAQYKKNVPMFIPYKLRPYKQND